MAILPLAPDMGTLMLFGAFFGVFQGASNSILPIVINIFVQGKDLPRAYGLVLAAQSPMYFFGAPIAGLVLQGFNSYFAGFLLGGDDVLAFLMLRTHMSYIGLSMTLSALPILQMMKLQK